MAKNELRPLLNESNREEDDEVDNDVVKTSTKIIFNGRDADDSKHNSSSNSVLYWTTTPGVSLNLGQWSIRQLLMRRKMLLLLIAILLIFYLHAILQEQRDYEDSDVLDLDNFVAVQHQSHVLGMKAAAVAAATVTVITATAAAPSTMPPPSSVVNITPPVLPPKGYLVWSDQCKIVDLDPYKREVMRYFKRIKYKPCATRKPLTRVDFNVTNKRYILSVDTAVLGSYVTGINFSCCYMTIERIDENHVDYSECMDFKRTAVLSNSTDSVVVKCRSNGKQIYINAHATVAERSEIRDRLNKWAARDEEVVTEGQQRGRAPSVLMVGIDSISRVNLIRAMPKTAQYLYDNEWFEMAGYNKIEDNTFPNIMALATGYNLTSAMSKCKPYKIGGLDNCEFIWKLYRDRGYVTAYGEDAVSINTFNYLKKGFKEPPVDYYMRPYLAAAEKLLSSTTESGLPQCLGYKHAAEHVYDYALEFARRYSNDSFFGFFWTNTHSHSDISQSTSMDERIRSYLQRLVDQGTMANSVVVFFSDHGMRFGPSRATWSGHLEERLPFVFIWLPPSLKHSHPEFVNALISNRNRLTNPFDLHMTLKHILTLAGREPSMAALGPAPDCLQCQSLLVPVPHNRTCAEVGIEDHWCTCWTYDSINKNTKTVQTLTKRVVQHINQFVANFQNGTFAKLCQPLSFGSTKVAYQARHNAGDADHVNTYRLVFYTKPNKALFEATVRHNETSDIMQVTGGVSRLNTYSGDSDCMGDFAAKKYCHCRRKSLG